MKAGEREPVRLLRRETVTTEHFHPRDRDSGRTAFMDRDREVLEDQRRDSGYAGDNIWGVSNKVVGTILGAAAGAAFAYAMVQGSDSPSTVSRTQEIPSGVRYSTRRSSVSGTGLRERIAPKVYYQEPEEEEEEDPLAYGGGGEMYAERRGRVASRVGQGRVETIPSNSGVSESGRKKYISYTIAPAPAPPSMRSRDLERIDERGGSHFSERSEGRRTRRSRSEVSGCRYPAAIALPPSTIFQDDRERDRKSRASENRSRRSGGGSETTIKPSGRAEYEPSNAGKSKGYSTTTIRVVPKSSASAVRDDQVDDYRERRSQASVRPSQVKVPATVVAPRGAPLPRSVVDAGREYAASVAPSDSVSSVGSKRERERLRMRMER